MSVNLFILGCPGSGKSTAYHHIDKFVGQHFPDWSTIRYNDYSILREMFLFEKLFQTDSKHRKFRSREHNGFDVIDFSVLDTALKELEKQVWQSSLPLKDELIVIEFARDDYRQALRQFRTNFLRDAYFLFIKTDMKICLQRVKDRISFPPTPDNHFVSEDILTKYYAKQIMPSIHSMPSIFIRDKGDSIDKRRVKVINSQGSLEDFYVKVEKFISKILLQEKGLSNSRVHNKVANPEVLTPLISPLHR